MADPMKLGFGCSGAWGMRWFSEKQAIRLIHEAIDLGHREFDTGNFYCDGEAERRLGRALKSLPSGVRKTLRVTSKTGTQKKPRGSLVKDFSETTIRQDVSTSLTRLAVDALDVLYLHGPDHASLASSLPVLMQLKTEGLINAIGVCGEGPGLAGVVGKSEIDVLMGAYNIFSRQHDATFATAKAHGQRVVAIAPLAQGLYRRDFMVPRSLPDVWYLARAATKNPRELQRARAAKWLHQEPGWCAGELALAFTLANPHIDVAITTTTKSAHLAANAAAAQRPLTPDLLTRLTTLAGDS